MFDAGAGSNAMVLRAQGAAKTASSSTTRGRAAPGFTDEEGTLVAAEIGETPVDQLVRARAQQIATRLAVPRPRSDSAAHRGSGTLASMPYRGGSDEIDLDRTIEMLAERPVPEDEDIIVRDRIRTRRSVVLAVDVSGSMKGERVQTAAATVGALAAELQHDALAVIAFWSDAAIVLNLGHEIKPLELLDSILRLPARGLTNVAFPLELAARQLARIPARDARVVLLSDCVHNAGPDPRLFAGRLPRLDVLIDTSGEHDAELGRELAALGRGRARLVKTHRDVAPALSSIFST
ncbi:MULTISPECIES: vWA domain-containing protein [Subtercola]|uniref:vWA domain-containing protein n=1 Tax=Subtercola TaxID=120212 RepID=UPI00191EF9FF|nr:MULTISPECIES: VWA domain-containing protein [Subtercola]MEA9985255.1 VWA domain-containing protein [Subtercola sp. RTI3]